MKKQLLWLVIILFIIFFTIFILFSNKKENNDVIGDYIQTNNTNAIHLNIQKDKKRIKGEIHIYRTKPSKEFPTIIEESDEWKLIGAPMNDTSYDLILTNEKGEKFNGILRTKNEISLQINGMDIQRGELLFTKIEKKNLNTLIKDIQKSEEHKKRNQEENVLEEKKLQQSHEQLKILFKEKISQKGYENELIDIIQKNIEKTLQELSKTEQDIDVLIVKLNVEFENLLGSNNEQKNERQVIDESYRKWESVFQEIQEKINTYNSFNNLLTEKNEMLMRTLEILKMSKQEAPKQENSNYEIVYEIISKKYQNKERYHKENSMLLNEEIKIKNDFIHNYKEKDKL